MKLFVDRLVELLITACSLCCVEITAAHDFAVRSIKLQSRIDLLKVLYFDKLDSRLERPLIERVVGEVLGASTSACNPTPTSIGIIPSSQITCMTAFEIPNWLLVEISPSVPLPNAEARY